MFIHFLCIANPQNSDVQFEFSFPSCPSLCKCFWFANSIERWQFWHSTQTHSHPFEFYPPFKLMSTSVATWLFNNPFSPSPNVVSIRQKGQELLFLNNNMYLILPYYFSFFRCSYPIIHTTLYIYIYIVTFWYTTASIISFFLRGCSI